MTRKGDLEQERREDDANLMDGVMAFAKSQFGKGRDLPPPDGIIKWCLETATVDHRPFNIEERIFLKDIYEDWHNKVCVMKSAQLGVTILAILKVVYFSAHRAITAIYTMPSAQDVEDFSQTRWDDLMNDSPKLAALQRAPCNTRIKTVGEGVIYFKGTWTERQAISVPSDINIHDELDFSNPSTVQTFKSRLGASKHKMQLLFSTPTMPGMGIHRFFMEKSDQRHWHIQCPTCDFEFAICCAYPDAIRKVGSCPDPDDRRRMESHEMEHYFACISCGNELTPEDRLNGKWVAANPGAEWHGYHPTILCAPWYTADDVMDEENEYEKPKDFINFTLGQPFKSSAMNVTPEIIRAAMDKKCKMAASADMSDRVTMGVDQGDVLYVVISKLSKMGIRQIIKVEMLGADSGFETLERYMKQYKVQMCVVDALPNKITAKRFAEKFAGKVWCAYYTRPENKSGLADWNARPKDKEWEVILNRSEALDYMYDRVVKLQWKLPPDPIFDQWFIKQMCNLRREQVEARNGEQRIVYTKVGPDHFAHANTYDEVARTRLNRVRGIKHIDFNQAPEPEHREDIEIEPECGISQKDRILHRRRFGI